MPARVGFTQRVGLLGSAVGIHGHPAIKVKSIHTPPVVRVTIAVLVNCECEPEYFPNLDIAKLAAAAPTWHGHQMRVIDGSGNFHPKISAQKAARLVQPQNYIGPNVAVEAIFYSWDSFRNSKHMWRPNPEMPHEDVMPKECVRALPTSQLSDQRPV